MAPAWTGVGVMKLAAAICCCRAGERLSSENSFNSFLARADSGLPLGPMFGPFHPGIQRRRRRCCVPGRLGLRQSCARLNFLCRENQGGAYEAPIRDLTHTHVFGWNALQHEPGARQPGPVQRGRTTITLRGLGRLREDGLADEGENGSQPNN